MAVTTVVALSAASGMVTSIELSYRNQRHPFGDRHFKAFLWWVVVVAVDAGVGVAVLFGVLTVKLAGQENFNTANGVWLGIIVGVLAPLALRSPVKNSTISNKQTTVGITYIYDLIRLNALLALDERFVRLKRRDVTIRRERWQSRGVDVQQVVNEFQRHIDDHVRLPADRREDIRRRVRIILTVPDDEAQMNGLIKLMKSERFNSLIDEFDARRLPSASIAAVEQTKTAPKIAVK